MELKELSEQHKNSITTKRINENEYQIQTKLFFSDETPYEIYLMQDKNGNRILTDKRRTLRYMDDFYELESEDVKSSIAEILDLYGVKIYQKALVLKLQENDDVVVMFYEFVQCIGQLINMYVFFDKPKEDD